MMNRGAHPDKRWRDHHYARPLHASFSLFCAVLAVTSMLGLLIPATMFGQDFKKVTDRNGKTISVPVNPKRIACFFGPSYEKVFLMGFGDRVAAMSLKQTPWAHKLNPLLKKATVMPSYVDPDVETILKLGVDLVFYWSWPQQTEKMTSAGIPVVCTMRAGNSPATREEFMQRHKEEIRFYGKVLGGDGKKIAEDYCATYDREIKKVIAITAKIPIQERPRVHYVTGRSVFGTQGANSLAYWLVEMAGGSLVSKDLPPGFVDASMEQIIAWNPAVILIGGLMSPELIHADPRWKMIKAVKDNRVYACPQGVFLWGRGSSEVHLFVLWLAKTLHPDKFRDLDIEREVKEYYAKFYRYKLSSDEVQRILKCLPPAELVGKPDGRKTASK